MRRAIRRGSGALSSACSALCGPSGPYALVGLHTNGFLLFWFQSLKTKKTIPTFQMTFSVTMTATALVLVLAAARANPYVGTDDDGNLQLRSAQGQGVFANNLDLVRLIPLFEATPCSPLHPSGDGRKEETRGPGI